MSDKPKKLPQESKTGGKPQYEAPRILPLGRTGAAEGGVTACSPGSALDNCIPGAAALLSCSTGTGVVPV